MMKPSTLVALISLVVPQLQAAEAVSSAAATDTAVASAAAIDTAVSSAAVTDTAVSSAAVTDTAVSSAAVTDTAVASAAVTDTAVASAAVTDTAVSSAAVTDTAVSSTAVTETSVSSAAATDTAVSSAAATDTAVASAAVTDTAVSSAAVTDAAVASAAVTDRAVSSAAQPQGPISASESTQAVPVDTPAPAVTDPGTPAPAVPWEDPLAARALEAVAIYRQDELLNWIEQGRHLKQVKQDRCQLTQDIEVRASVMKIPAYQFLWGDMLAWGVCIKPDAELGVQYMWDAANQGLAPALEQLGRYYWQGRLVQKDLIRAETLMREAASLGFLRARLEWVEMLLQGMGSPLDYEEAYHWLHDAVIGDKGLHQKAASLLSRLGNRMPANAIARAKAMH